MANILLIGAGPLPEPDATRTHSHTLRTWQIAKPLLESPHNLKLIALPGQALPEATNASRDETLEYDGFLYTMLAPSDTAGIVQSVKKISQAFNPSCMVAVGQYAAYVASQIDPSIPLWIDLPGSPLSAAQLEAQVAGTEAVVERVWERQRAILLRGDKFSAASMPQLYSTLGELGIVGRMNRLTASYHFAHYVPDAVHPLFVKTSPASTRKFRGVVVPEDAFVVLWSGSFGPASDVQTLVAGMEKAMAHNDKIHFVCTGGTHYEQSDSPYRQLLHAAESGPFAPRYHFLGWTGFSRLPELYRECDLGLCIDGMNYEALLGTRVRILNMMAAGLPVAATLGAELTHMLEEEGFGFTLPVCDEDALAQTLLNAAHSPGDLKSMGQTARQFVLRNFSASSVCKPIREWVDRPELAPDNLKQPTSAIQRHLADIRLDYGKPGAFSKDGVLKSLTRSTMKFIRKKH